MTDAEEEAILREAYRPIFKEMDQIILDELEAEFHPSAISMTIPMPSRLLPVPDDQNVHGRPVYSREQMAQMDPPLPPESEE